VLVPALLGQEGPDLATSAVLHLGTLAAVIAYYRRDIVMILRFDRPGRRLLTLIAIGTIPAAIGGLAFRAVLEELNETPEAVAVALIATGVVLLSTMLVRVGDETVADIGPNDAGIIGVAQATALIPGVSRSGMTIAAGLWRGLARVEAARFAFLLGIPAIAGAGLLEFGELISEGGGVPATTWAGMLVAGLSGYVAIAILIRILTRIGLAPFGIYCVALGVISLVAL
jgi:undecaprenyl-diphosphatase